jgi:hypothetical protein
LVSPPTGARGNDSIDPKLPLEPELYPTHERDPDAHGGLGSSRHTGCLAPADVAEMGSSSRRVTSMGEPAASRTAPAGAASPLRASSVPRGSCAGAVVRRTPCAAAAIGAALLAPLKIAPSPRSWWRRSCVGGGRRGRRAGAAAGARLRAGLPRDGSQIRPLSPLTERIQGTTRPCPRPFSCFVVLSSSSCGRHDPISKLCIACALRVLI